MTSSNVRALIPLYINGALGDWERASFERAMRADAELRREYAEFLDIEQAFKEAEARCAVDHEVVLRVTLAHIRREAERVARAAGSLPERETATALFKRLLRMPQVAWGVAVAQVALIAVLVAYLPDGREVAQTLSESAGTAQSAPRLHVVFAERATQQQVRTLLARIDARISDGPTQVGMVTLELRNREADVRRTIETLRTSGIVVFVERGY